MTIFVKCDECGKELSSWLGTSSFGLLVRHPNYTHGKTAPNTIKFESKGICENCSKPIMDEYRKKINSAKTDEERESAYKFLVGKMFKLKTFRRIN
jgi:hypothetical protein